jgi:hypothetical protein
LRLQPEHIAATRCDVVLVNGEGTLHHDRPGAQRIGKLGLELKKLGLPAYLINTVYEANSSTISDGVSAYRNVWVRESLSAAEMANEGISCTVVPDLSLTWCHDVSAKRGTRLVVLDAVDDEEARQLFDLSGRLDAPYYSIMTKPPRINTFPDRNLKRIAKYYWRRAIAHLRPPSPGRSKWLNQFPSFEVFVEQMTAEAALIITGRLHAMCIAFDLEIPVLAIPSNTHKIDGLLKDAGLESRTIKNASAIADLGNQPLASYAYSDDELGRIRAYRNRALSEARTMFAEIANGSGH